MAKGEVHHSGKIVSINPQFTTVEFVSESACSSCHAAGLCGMGEMETKLVQVPTDPHKRYELGQKVNVNLRATMGLKAVWISYCIPLVILIALMLILYTIGVGELLTGLCSILGVCIYYFVIWIFRDKLKDEYIFTISEI